MRFLRFKVVNSEGEKRRREFTKIFLEAVNNVFLTINFKWGDC